MTRPCLSIAFNIILIVPLMDVFRGKEPTLKASIWSLSDKDGLLRWRSDLVSISLVHVLDLCVKLNGIGVQPRTPPAPVCLPLVLFMLKERRWAFWHFNNVALPINSPWPKWKKCPLSSSDSANVTCCKPTSPKTKKTHVGVLSPPPPPGSPPAPLCPLDFVRHRGLWWGRGVIN